MKTRLCWAIHNIIAHPTLEVLKWVGLARLGEWFHDFTLPKDRHTTSLTLNWSTGQVDLD